MKAGKEQLKPWKKHIVRLAIAALVLLAILYAADWLTFRYRVSRGTAFGSIEVDQFLATSLKGSKTEYDMIGSFQQTCSHSIFPQQGKPACWWVNRHNTQWE